MRQSSAPSTSSVGVEWEPDSASSVCRVCSVKWGFFSKRRHHCRKCGRLVCNGCSKARVNLTPYDKKPSRTCDDCLRPPPPVITQPIEFVRAKTRIPFSDESPTLLGSPEAIFRKSLIADNAKVASVIEETEKSLLLDLSNRTGEEAAESALLNANEAEEEVYSDEEEEETPENPIRKKLLNLEEMSSHLSAHDSQVSTASPKSEGGNSYLSESTDPPAVLAAVKEGQADVRSRMSVGKELRLSISKFGVMSFTDDEESAAPPSTMSFYEGSVSTFPLSPDAALDLQELLSPVSVPISAAVTAPESAPNTVQENVNANTETNVIAEDKNVTDIPVEAQNESSTASDNLTPSDPPTEDVSSHQAPSSSETIPPAGNSAVKGTPKVVLKGTPGNAPNPLKLTPGLSPMPSGNTVRRLSTLAPRGSPYTMAAAPATVAASASAAAVTSPEPTAGPGGKVHEDANAVPVSEMPMAEVAADIASVSVVTDENVATTASTSKPDATFTGTSVTSLFASVESESTDDYVVTDAATANVTSATTSVDVSTETPTAPARVLSPPNDVSGVVSDNKKLKGGKNRNANGKGRGLKM